MCFSLPWLIDLLIRIVVVVAFIAILYKLVPYFLNMVGMASDLVMQVIKIIVVAALIIFLLWLAYVLVTCVGLGPTSYHRLP